MFLRAKSRLKDGKEHRYWSIVENRRVGGGRVVQRHVLYLGEINDTQKESWCKTIEVFDEGRVQSKQMAPTIQMVDVHLPTTDRREVILSRYTQPEKDLQMLLARLRLQLPEQPPPKVTMPASTH